MAELIPMTYRLRLAQKQQIRKWMLVGMAALGVSLASVTSAFVWQRQRAAEYHELAAQFQKKSATIAQAHQMVGSRQELANRMQKVQQLTDDKMLLSLLRNISDGFSTTDRLEYIAIDTHSKKPDADKDKPKDDSRDKKDKAAAAVDHYVVRISGITESSATLSDLMNRLSMQTAPPMNVVLESSHRENLYDGQVMRFEISCEKPEAKGT